MRELMPTRALDTVEHSDDVNNAFDLYSSVDPIAAKKARCQVFRFQSVFCTLCFAQLAVRVERT